MIQFDEVYTDMDRHDLILFFPECLPVVRHDDFLEQTVILDGCSDGMEFPVGACMFGVELSLFSFNSFDAAALEGILKLQEAGLISLSALSRYSFMRCLLGVIVRPRYFLSSLASL